MERREFLRRAGLIAGAVTVGGGLATACSSGKSPGPSFDSIINHSAKDSKIDTVVIVMMENRSFDHYLGWLADDEQYLEAGKRRYGNGFQVLGKNNMRYADPLGRGVRDRAPRDLDPGAGAVPRLRPPDPGPRLEQRPGAARPRLPRQGHRQRRVRPRLLRGRGPARSTASSPRASPCATAGTRRCSRARSRTASTCTRPRRRAARRTRSRSRSASTRRETIWDRLDEAQVPRALLLHRPPGPDAVGPAPVRQHLQDRRVLQRRRRPGKLPNVVMVDPPFRGRAARRRPPAGRHPDRPAVRPRGVPGVHAVTAVGARRCSSSSTTSGAASSTTAAPAQFADDARQRRQRRRLRPGRLPRAGDGRVAVRRAGLGQPHALRPHVDHAVPRVALPRRAAARARGARRRRLVAHRARPQREQHRAGARAREARPRARLRHRPRPADLLARVHRAPRRARRSAGRARARSRRSCRS